MMASISKEYYQFLLSQAVCSSIGASMVFYPAFSATITWFFKKRAMAVGIAAAGSSLGGVIFPIMVSRLVVEVGFGWTMRICAFLVLGLLIIANLFIKSRIPPHPRPVKLVDFVMPLTEPTFALLTVVWVLFLPISSLMANGNLGLLPLLYGTFHTFHLHHP
jgi:MFS family permease